MTKVALAALAVVAIAGFAARLIPTAQAGTVSIADLPGLGYSLGVRVDASTTPTCQEYWVLSGNGAPETLIGDFDDTNHPACNTDPAVMQARIDALLADYPPRPVPAETVTLPAETVTAPAVTVTTPAETVTTPPVTVTSPAVTLPAITTPAQTVERTETVTLPAVTLPVVTTTVTDTTMVASLQARVTAQHAQIVKQQKRLAARLRVKRRR